MNNGNTIGKLYYIRDIGAYDYRQVSGAESFSPGKEADRNLKAKRVFMSLAFMMAPVILETIAQAGLSTG